MIQRSGKIIAGLVAAVVTPLLLATMVILTVVNQGPLSLARFTPQFERVLSDQIPELDVALRDTVLAWDPGRSQLEVRVLGVELRAPDGDVLGQFPEVAVDLDGAALIRGQIRPVGIELLAPDLSLERAADNNIYLLAADGTARWPLARVLPVIGGADGAAGGGGAQVAGLARLSARDARVTFSDRTADLTLQARQVMLDVSQGATAISVSLTAMLQVGESEVPIGLGAVRRHADKVIDTTIRFRDLELAVLLPLLPEDARGQLESLSMRGEGEVDAVFSGAGSLTRARIDLAVAAGQATLPKLFPDPLQLAGGNLRASVRPAEGTIDVEWLELNAADGVSASFVGQLGGLDDALWLRGEAGFLHLSPAALSAYWPLIVSPKVRRWVLEHVYAGRIPEGRLKVDIRPGDLRPKGKRDEMLEMEFSFEDASASYLGTLPHLTAARGKGRLTGRRFVLDLESAEAGELRLSEGQVVVADTEIKPAVLDIKFLAHGPTAAALGAIDEKPLGLARKLRIDPLTAQGESASRVRLRFPMRRKLDLDDVEVAARSTITGYAAPDVMAGFPLSEGDLELTVDGQILRAVGQALINGVPAEIDWRRPLRAPDGGSDEVRLRATLDRADRESFGLRFGDQIEGPTTIEARLVRARSGAVTGSAEVEMAGATLNIPVAKWQKAPGTPARLDFDFTSLPGEGLTLSDLRFEADGLTLSGELGFSPELAFQRSRLDQVSLGVTRLAMDLRVLPGGGYRVDAQGESLDLRAHMKDMMDLDSRPDPDLPDLDVTARFDSVILSEGIGITRLRAGASRRDGNWVQVNASGAVNGGPPALLRVSPEEGARSVQLFSGDAGAMARALGLTDGADGGRMYLEIRVPDQPPGAAAAPPPPLSGELRAEDIRLTDAPILAQMLTLGSLTGVRDLMRGDGINLARLRAPFTYAQDVLSVDDARAVGPALGITATASHNRETGILEADGTVVPSYTLNSVLGRIPYIGDIFVGREGEGVFAFTYKISGPIAKPKVTVNPLSALAPGFLRNIVTDLQDPVITDEMTDLQRKVEEDRELK